MEKAAGRTLVQMRIVDPVCFRRIEATKDIAIRLALLRVQKKPLKFRDRLPEFSSVHHITLPPITGVTQDVAPHIVDGRKADRPGKNMRARARGRQDLHDGMMEVIYQLVFQKV